MHPAPGVEILSWLGVGGLMGVGFPGNYLPTVLPNPKQGKPPTLRSVGEGPVYSQLQGGKCFLHLQKKRIKVFQALNGSSVVQKTEGILWCLLTPMVLDLFQQTLIPIPIPIPKPMGAHPLPA